MRNVLLATCVGLLFCVVGCASSQRTLQAGCATCIFDMKSVTGCPLAVKVAGQPYLVEGVKMDELGDAHAADGLCNVERTVKAEGKIKGDRFVATSMEIVQQ